MVTIQKNNWQLADYKKALILKNNVSHCTETL